jgi:hypothetical protein
VRGECCRWVDWRHFLHARSIRLGLLAAPCAAAGPANSGIRFIEAGSDARAGSVRQEWQRIKCAVFGHRWVVGPDDCLSDITAARDCACGAHIAAIKWPRGVSKQQTIWSPTSPRAGMHPPPPPARVITGDRYNRKHKIGAYDPQYIAQVKAFKAWSA